MTEIRWIRLHDKAVAPRYARPGDAGADLCIVESITLQPGERALVGTGIAVAIPAGFVGLVTPRSGLAHSCGLGMVNSPGVIDSGYRGELRLNLVNHDPNREISLQAGERVAQLLLVPIATAVFDAVEELDDTDRGQGGHGSTGGASALTNR